MKARLLAIAMQRSASMSRRQNVASTSPEASQPTASGVIGGARVRRGAARRTSRWRAVGHAPAQALRARRRAVTGPAGPRLRASVCLRGPAPQRAASS
jgi:hypothetical protein